MFHDCLPSISTVHLSTLIRNLFSNHLTRPLVIGLLAGFVSNAEAFECQPVGSEMTGTYRLTSPREAASFISLNEDGKFEFALAYGSVDAYARGCWNQQGDVVDLTSKRKVQNVFLMKHWEDGKPVEPTRDATPDDHGSGGDWTSIGLVLGAQDGEIWLEYADGVLFHKKSKNFTAEFERRNMPPISRVGVSIDKDSPPIWINNNDPGRYQFVITSDDDETLRPNAFSQMKLNVRRPDTLQVEDGSLRGRIYQRYY